MAFFGVGEENFIVGGGGRENSHLACHTQAEKGNIGEEGGGRGKVLRMKARRFPKRNNSRHC